MKICEIFTSIQGESSYCGQPCTFIRVSGCNLRCNYCDTQYAYNSGKEMTVKEIVKLVKAERTNLVEVTGGEPLLQEIETKSLIKNLINEGFKLLIETNGSLSIKDIDMRAIIILDIKTPGSGMHEKMEFSNLNQVKKSDEVKFVISNRTDYDWAKRIIDKYRLVDKCGILFSPCFGRLAPLILAKWIIDDRLGVRLNLQLQKYVFGPEERGV